jgi:AraC-like DNA-binding protein
MLLARAGQDADRFELAERATALAEALLAGLRMLAARAVGVSAYHLSRTFRAVTGLTLSRYRIRLRLRRVLERLADGERDLAGLAAEAGFADQARSPGRCTLRRGPRLPRCAPYSRQMVVA